MSVVVRLMILISALEDVKKRDAHCSRRHETLHSILIRIVAKPC
jgi:hypothetical protein